jgi:hypothetical protein
MQSDSQTGPYAVILQPTTVTTLASRPLHGGVLSHPGMLLYVPGPHQFLVVGQTHAIVFPFHFPAGIGLSFSVLINKLLSLKYWSNEQG